MIIKGRDSDHEDINDDNSSMNSSGMQLNIGAKKISQDNK